MIENLDLRCSASAPYVVRDARGRRCWIQDLEVEHADAPADRPRRAPARASRRRSAGLARRAENDGFNRLVLAPASTGARCWCCAPYAPLGQQVGLPFARLHGGGARAHPALARTAASSSSSRASTRGSPRAARTAQAEAARREIDAALEHGDEPDDDRILRAFLAVIDATLRTNYFQPTPRRAEAVPVASSSTRSACRSCRCRGRCARSSCIRRASRACTCAWARSRAAACAGRTGARTSAPRSSA